MTLPNNVNRQHEVAVKFAEIGNELVGDGVGVILQKQNTSVTVAKFEIIPFKFQTFGRDHVLEIVTAAHKFPQVKLKMIFLARIEEIVKQVQPLLRVQLVAAGADLIIAIQINRETKGDDGSECRARRRTPVGWHPPRTTTKPCAH